MEFHVNNTGEAFLIYIENNIVIVNAVTRDPKIKEEILRFINERVIPNQHENIHNMNQILIKLPSF